MNMRRPDEEKARELLRVIQNGIEGLGGVPGWWRQLEFRDRLTLNAAMYVARGEELKIELRWRAGVE